METLNVSYDKVVYYGVDKQKLNFWNLVINGISYGDYTVDVSSDLGTALHNYVLSTEKSIDVVSSGEDIDEFTVYSSNLVASTKSFVMDYLNQVAMTKGFLSTVDCASYYNSSDQTLRDNAIRFIKWRDDVLSTFDALVCRLNNKEIGTNEFNSDYVLSALPPMIWDSDEETEREETLEQVITLEDAKYRKLTQLKDYTRAFEDNINNDMWFMSSVNGIKVNGDRRTKENIKDLIEYSTTDAVMFRDYSNNLVELSKEQLSILLKELVINGQNLYYQKWRYEEAINSATSIAELNSISLFFSMSNFNESHEDNQDES